MHHTGRHSRFRFPREEELEKLADEEGRSLMDVISEAIDDYIRKEDFIRQEIKMKFLAESASE